jgi:2-amino-4-hydroxy-6-hydroxymethyldihydropteridine diphosphokinase
MPRVFLGLGSNVAHDRLTFLRSAHRLLAEALDLRLLDTSPLYETEPWESAPGTGLDECAWFLNCVVAVETALSPAELLRRLQEIETALGRVRPPGTPEAQRFAPRTLDIDILFYADRVVSVPDELQIPHLLLHERGFVLRPLADIAPDFEHPTLYRTVRELLEELADDHAVRLAPFPARWYEG